MDRNLLVVTLPGGATLPLDSGAVPKAEAEIMQALRNGSAEYRVAQALQEAEVKVSHWPWETIRFGAEVFFALVALGFLVWAVFPK